MSVDFSGKLIIAISSRALFNLDNSHTIFEKEGLDAYHDFQIAHEKEILSPGIAFSIVQKLLAIRDPETNESLVEVILLSRNSADTGLRIFNSIQEHKLDITRAAFTNGKSPYEYISAFGSHLFLSANQSDVRVALNAGCAAATLFSGTATPHTSPELRIAFDGDAVLFSDEAERIFQDRGLDAFSKNETEHATNPLPGGPFKGFLTALHTLQSRYAEYDTNIADELCG